MLITTSDTRNLPYAITSLRVAHGGQIRYREPDGRIRAVVVRSGGTLKNIRLIRLYSIGTTASGFSTDAPAGSPSVLQYLPAVLSTLADGEVTSELRFGVDVTRACVGFYLATAGSVTYRIRGQTAPIRLDNVQARHILRQPLLRIVTASTRVWGVFAPVPIQPYPEAPPYRAFRRTSGGALRRTSQNHYRIVEVAA